MTHVVTRVLFVGLPFSSASKLYSYHGHQNNGVHAYPALSVQKASQNMISSIDVVLFASCARTQKSDNIFCETGERERERRNGKKLGEIRAVRRKCVASAHRPNERRSRHRARPAVVFILACFSVSLSLSLLFLSVSIFPSASCIPPFLTHCIVRKSRYPLFVDENNTSTPLEESDGGIKNPCKCEKKKKSLGSSILSPRLY